MNIKTGKVHDWKTGKPKNGVWVDVNVDGPDDANTEAILDPKVKEVDLGNGVKARDVFGIGSKVVAAEDLLDAIEKSIAATTSVKSAVKTASRSNKDGLKRRTDL